MGAIKNNLAAALAITAAMLLAGCDISAQRRAAEAEARVATLEEKLKAAEEKASQAYDYRRAAAVAQACGDWPIVSRICPAQDLALGKAAIADGYTADEGVFWAARIGLLAALGAALGAAVAAGWALWLRIVAPAKEELEEAEHLVQTAKNRAEQWRIAEHQAQNQPKRPQKRPRQPRMSSRH